MEEAREERERDREGREAGHYIMYEYNNKPCE
jgi:hypothetical protein